jgi:hypothetical protein
LREFNRKEKNLQEFNRKEKNLREFNRKEKNVRELNGEEINLRQFNGEEMNSASDITPTGSIKRTSSRRSMTASTDVTQDTGSVPPQRSSGSTAHYRYDHLVAAEVHIHDLSPQADIQARIDGIIKAKVSEERQAKRLAIS